MRLAELVLFTQPDEFLEFSLGLKGLGAEAEARWGPGGCWASEPEHKCSSCLGDLAPRGFLRLLLLPPMNLEEQEEEG